MKSYYGPIPLCVFNSWSWVEGFDELVITTSNNIEGTQGTLKSIGFKNKLKDMKLG